MLVVLSVWALVMMASSTDVTAQIRTETLHLMQPDSIPNKPRQLMAFGISGGVFVSSGIGLYTTWYSQFETSPFHFFDDSKEWLQMDKYGHVYTAYFQSEMCYKVAKWTGMSKNRSILYGASCGFILQATVEVFDGYSEKWGFSVYDIAANSAGVGLFAAQQLAWDEQRIRVKMSSQLNRSYDNINVENINGEIITDLSRRTNNLFGDSVSERFLKDYNAQTYWLSVNPRSFGVEFMPNWLNIAVGFGAENLYGGFENTWEEDGEIFDLNIPRYRQFYISPDIDFARFNPKSHWVKTLFTMLNIYKLPMPAAEYNREEGWSFHLLLVR
jgi:uncharacterized protein YfiM (DUF2279 family)